MSRGSERGCSTRAYRAWRARYLARHPLCAGCAREGLTVAAVELDHVVPLVKGGALMDERNVQGLCRECHEAKTAADFGKRRRVEDRAWDARLRSLR